MPSNRALIASRHHLRPADACPASRGLLPWWLDAAGSPRATFAPGYLARDERGIRASRCVRGERCDSRSGRCRCRTGLRSCPAGGVEHAKDDPASAACRPWKRCHRAPATNPLSGAPVARTGGVGRPPDCPVRAQRHKQRGHRGERHEHFPRDACQLSERPPHFTSRRPRVVARQPAREWEGPAVARERLDRFDLYRQRAALAQSARGALKLFQ